MLTEKQNQIIEQIKQEFENHNQVIDLRKNQKSRFNFESIISEIQRREDFISELKQINIAEYNVIEANVREEIEVLNSELEILGFVAELEPKHSATGGIDKWMIHIGKIGAEKIHDKRIAWIEVYINRTEILFVGKKIEGYYRVNTNYTFSFNGYIGSFSALFKNERVRERLAFLWEVHIKNKS